MLACACSSFGPLVALRNGFSVTSISSAVSSAFLGYIISDEIIETKRRFKGEESRAF